AGIHVHFAAEFRQARHMPNPIRAAQRMLKMHSFQITAAMEWAGIILPIGVSRMAVPITAITRLSATRPPNLSDPSTASYLKSLIRAVLCIWRKQALSLIDLPDQTLSMIE